MCDSIANGGPRYAAQSCPPANVIIASNVLSTNGNVIAGNIIAVDGTFTGNLYVAGNLVSNISYATLNVSGTINAGSIVTGNVSGNGAGLSALNATNLFGSANLTNLVVQNSVTTTNLFVNSSANVTNLVVSNSVSTTNLFVNSAANLAALNVSGTTNIATLNVTTLFANSATVFGPTTLNVFGISNLNSVLAQSLNVAGAANLNSVVSALYSGNGSGLSNLPASNLIGNVANASVALVVSQPAQPNVTSLGILTGLTVSGLLVASNGSGISNINSSNLVGNVAAANVATVVTNPTQANITSLGTLTALNVSGISNLSSIASALISGNGSGISNINGSNVSTVGTAQSVTNAAQPNITSLGTLTGLYSTGNVSASLFIGGGNALSNVQVANLSGTVNFANTAGSVTNAAQPNITSVGTLTSLGVTGTVSAGTLVGDGQGIFGIHANAITETVATANSVVQSAQPNITSVGTLTALNVSGISNLNSVVSSLFSGNGSGLSNLNSSNLVGNVAQANVALVVSQPAQPNVTSVGTLTGLNVSGISNLNSVVSALFSGNGSGLSNLNSSNLVGNVVAANVAGVVTNPAQTNITSVGTLTGLTVSGLLVASNGSGISNINSSNLTGTVPTGVLPTSGVTAGLYGSGANVSSVTVDQYGRITAASNIAITASQWTSNTGNTIYYANFVGIGSTFTPTANLHVIGNVYASNSVTTTNIFFTNSIQATNLPTSGVTAGGYGSAANIPQLVVDQYGRVTAASNLGVTLSSQWTSVDGNVAYQNGVSIGTLSNPPVGSNLYVLGTANIDVINTSSLFVATSNLTTNNVATLVVRTQANLVSANVTTGNIATANIATENVVTSNIATANVTNLTVRTLANLVSANVVTANITTGNIVTANITTANVATSNITNLTVRTLANLVSANVTTGNIATANITTENVSTSNIANLTVRTLANLVSANVTTANIATANTTSENVGTLNVSSQFSVAGVMSAASGNTTIFLDTLVIPYINVTTTANISALNVVGTTNLTTLNGTTANFTSIFAQNSNLLNANIGTENVVTLNGLSIFATNSNLSTANVGTLNGLSIFATNSNLSTANIGTENVVTLNGLSIFATNSNVGTLNSSGISVTNLNVASNSNVGNLVVMSNILAGPAGNTYVSGNLVVAGNVYSALGTPLGAGGALYLSLGATTTPSTYTGVVYGQTLALSLNAFTVTGTSTSISRTANGYIQFAQTGVYSLRAVFTTTADNITGLAIGSNVAEVHGTDQTYVYRYMSFVSQNPTETFEIDFYVGSTTAYYFIDLFAVDAPTLQPTSNALGGTWLTISPVNGSSGGGSTTIATLGNCITNSSPGAGDYYVGVTNGGTITLPYGSGLSAGKQYVIKDESGLAETSVSKQVTVAASGSDLIDGQASFIIALNYGAVSVIWTGTKWSIF